MSFVPARKGGNRMEALHRYSHQPMALLLETDPDVVWWTSRTEPCPVSIGGKDCEVVPHFLVHRTCEHQAIRIVRARRFSAATLELHEAATAAYEERGIQFQVVRECDLLADPRLPAAISILWHRAWEPPGEMKARTAALAADPPRTLGELHQVIGGGAVTWPLVVALVAHGWVQVDQSTDISPQTQVRACTLGGIG